MDSRHRLLRQRIPTMLSDPVNNKSAHFPKCMFIYILVFLHAICREFSYFSP